MYKIKIKIVNFFAKIFICYCPENAVGKKFYESFGFKDTGLVVDGENITKLDLK